MNLSQLRDVEHTLPSSTVYYSQNNRDRRRQSLRESLDRANQLRQSVEKKYGVGRRGVTDQSHDVKLTVCGQGVRARSRTPPGNTSPRFTKETKAATVKDPTERFWSALRGSMVEHRVEHIMMPEERHAEQAFIDRSVSPPKEVEGVGESSDISSLVQRLREAHDDGQSVGGVDDDGDILERWRTRRKGLGIVFDSVDTVVEEEEEDAGGAERVLERIRKRLGGMEATMTTTATHKMPMSPSRLVRRLLRKHDRLGESLVLTSSSSSSSTSLFTSSAPTSSAAQSIAQEARPSPESDAGVVSIDLLGSPPVEEGRGSSASAAGASISFELTPRDGQKHGQSMDSLALSVDEEVEGPLVDLMEFEDAPQTNERRRSQEDVTTTATALQDAEEVNVIAIGVQIAPEMIDCAVQADLHDTALPLTVRRGRSFSGPPSLERRSSAQSPRGEVAVIASCEMEYDRAREEFRALAGKFLDL